MGATILLIDDEASIRMSLRGILEDEGYSVLEAGSGEEGLEAVGRAVPDLVFLDVWMPGMDGVAVQERLHTEHPRLPVVMISGHATVETAVKAIRNGAYDFIEKPLSLEKVLITVRRALEAGTLRKENAALRVAIPGDDRMLGGSLAMRSFMEALGRVAPTEAWVLLTGENGTGKELAAKALHRGSRRSGGPLVTVNCAAIPEELIESELFGHEKGAFTGSSGTRIGRFELADGGTLFLDEIGDMSLRVQAKVLRILQERTFERVGGTRTIKVDVRVIAATNKDLEASIRAGTFREDLYYRLAVVPLRLPPLRERDGDVELLLGAFLARQAKEQKSAPPVVDVAALDALKAYAWPGNVRELRNFAERMAILYAGKTVGVMDLPREMRGGTGEDMNGEGLFALDYKSAKAAFETRYLRHRLDKAGGNVGALAEQIGLERTYAYKKLKECGLRGE